MELIPSSHYVCVALVGGKTFFSKTVGWYMVCVRVEKKRRFSFLEVYMNAFRQYDAEGLALA